MALIKSIKGKEPIFGKDVYLAENATVIGEVTMGDYCSVWFSSVLRADVNSITIGNKVNIQDGVVVHCTYQKASTILGNNITIGHNALVHGCTIRNNVLVGMGAIVMDKAVINSNSIIAAGAVILEGTNVESGALYAGVPAKKIKDLNEKEIAKLIQETADNYVMYSSWFLD